MRSGRAFARYTAIAIVVTLLVLVALPVAAFDFRLQVAPEVLFPVDDPEIYGIGFGASLRADTEITDHLAPWAGIQFNSIPPAASDIDGSLVLTSFGGGLRTFFYPRARLKLGAIAGGGVYMGSYQSGAESIPTGNIFWQAGIDGGYRFSPRLTVSTGLSYVDFRRQADSLYSGIALSVSADFAFLSSSEGRAVLDSAESVPIYPIRAPEYRERDFGSISIRNAESAEIRNVEVTFRSGKYSSSPILCGGIDYLPRGAVATFPLYANFSDQVMTVTEQLRTTGQIDIRYELLGEPRSAEAETTISFLNRNTFTWEDPKVLASFVTPNDQALLDISKYVAGLVRSETRGELDSNLQYALALFEGFRHAGIAWSVDPQTPYSRMRKSPEENDYVQYPHQTIAYRGGDSDDLAVLYAAAVESVGVPAALVPFEEDVLVAVKLKSDEARTRSFFLNGEDFLLIDGEVWVPVRVSKLREGFLTAWSDGARLAREHRDLGGQRVEDLFFRLEEAWKLYPPVAVPGIRVTAARPPGDEVLRAFVNLITLVVEREVAPRAERMREAFGPGGGTGRQINALGVLYARYGLYDEALEEFQGAAEAGYSAAHINIGNVAFLLGDYDTALVWYERVAGEFPESPAAIIGLARTYYELDEYELADDYFNQAKELVPAFGERYSYLSARITDSVARASGAMDRLGDMVWEE